MFIVKTVITEFLIKAISHHIDFKQISFKNKNIDRITNM